MVAIAPCHRRQYKEQVMKLPFSGLAGLIVSVLLVACASREMPTPEAVGSSSANSPLAFLHGEWVGIAKGVTPDGVKYEITQTERVGPLMGGEVTLIEGRGYAKAGNTAFNAFAVVALKPGSDDYQITSYSGGQSGTFPFDITETGYVWGIPLGPAGRTEFKATISGDTWFQTGHFIPANGPPVQTFEMTLKRRGDTDWPAKGAVKP
jgi:hypothetical protein